MLVNFSIVIFLIYRFWHFSKSIIFYLKHFEPSSLLAQLNDREGKLKSHYSAHDIAVADPFEILCNRSVCFRARRHIEIYGETYFSKEIYKRHYLVAASSQYVSFSLTQTNGFKIFKYNTPFKNRTNILSLMEKNI